MAIACLRLFTLRPDPLFSVPRFLRRIALSTVSCAFLLYFFAIRPPRSLSTRTCEEKQSSNPQCAKTHPWARRRRGGSRGQGGYFTQSSQRTEASAAHSQSAGCCHQRGRCHDDSQRVISE